MNPTKTSTYIVTAENHHRERAVITVEAISVQDAINKAARTAEWPRLARATAKRAAR